MPPWGAATVFIVAILMLIVDSATVTRLPVGSLGLGSNRPMEDCARRLFRRDDENLRGDGILIGQWGRCVAVVKSGRSERSIGGTDHQQFMNYGDSNHKSPRTTCPCLLAGTPQGAKTVADQLADTYTEDWPN